MGPRHNHYDPEYPGGGVTPPQPTSICNGTQNGMRGGTLSTMPTTRLASSSYPFAMRDEPPIRNGFDFLQTLWGGGEQITSPPLPRRLAKAPISLSTMQAPYWQRVNDAFISILGRVRGSKKHTAFLGGLQKAWNISGRGRGLASSPSTAWEHLLMGCLCTDTAMTVWLNHHWE